MVQLFNLLRHVMVVADISTLRAADDAAECLWIAPEDLRPEDFGLDSIREGVRRLKIEN